MRKTSFLFFSWSTTHTWFHDCWERWKRRWNYHKNLSDCIFNLHKSSEWWEGRSNCEKNKWQTKRWTWSCIASYSNKQTLIQRQNNCTRTALIMMMMMTLNSTKQKNAFVIVGVYSLIIQICISFFSCTILMIFSLISNNVERNMLVTVF